MDICKFSHKTPQIYLIGNQKNFASDENSEELLSFYENLFGRLKREVKKSGVPSRYVGYQSPVNEAMYLHFLGLEVDEIEQIPRNMIAWELSGDTRTVWRMQGGQKIALLKEKIRWQWHNQSVTDLKTWTGEFTARSTAPFWITGNAYLGKENNASIDDIELIDYDPSWSQQFEVFASWLKNLIGADLACRVEHYGSTAIFGMPAKPIIDILVEIPSFKVAKKHVIPFFNNKTWEYWWHATHMIFVKRKKLMGERTCHVHMAPKEHEVWNALAFRDYLGSHPKEALRYADLKRKLAIKYPKDRERYTKGKTEFVKKITAKALNSRTHQKGGFSAWKV
jgi:GrpB-like predicted nucleotidyltransferase (UPF0157 family)/predicted transcriptional regulator YdeE